MDEVISDTGFGDFPEWREANEGSEVQLCNSLENVQLSTRCNGVKEHAATM